MDSSFAPLRAALLKEKYSLSEVFGLINGFALADPPLCAAMCAHAQEHLLEKPNDTPSELLIAIFWMTFFDVDRAIHNSSLGFAFKSPQEKQIFVQYVVNGLEGDRKVRESGSFMSESKRAH